MGEKSLWMDVVKARYGEFKPSRLSLDNGINFAKSLGWWKSICSIGACPFSHDWFASCLSKHIGNGDATRF
ncbi:MAG: hypothetical protein Q8877_03025 [Sweet potato little leaf phytoplasma]|nr:hypothetical protein [Sweet potato little leaf phytoplasma]